MFKSYRVVILSIALIFCAFTPTHADTYTDQVQEMYVAYYGRPGDPEGLAWWAGKLRNSNGNLSEIINNFGNSSEYTSRFGTFSQRDLVNNIFSQLFGRNADTAGLDWYVNKLESGDPSWSLASIALRIADGVASGSADAQVVANRLQLANAFTSAVGDGEIAYSTAGDISAAVSMLRGVTHDSATLSEALASMSGGGQGSDGATITEVIHGVVGANDIARYEYEVSKGAVVSVSLSNFTSDLDLILSGVGSCYSANPASEDEVCSVNILESGTLVIEISDYDEVGSSFTLTVDIIASSTGGGTDIDDPQASGLVVLTHTGTWENELDPSYSKTSDFMYSEGLLYTTYSTDTCNSCSLDSADDLSVLRENRTFMEIVRVSDIENPLQARLYTLFDTSVPWIANDVVKEYGIIPDRVLLTHVGSGHFWFELKGRVTGASGGMYAKFPKDPEGGQIDETYIFPYEMVGVFGDDFHNGVIAGPVLDSNFSNSSYKLYEVDANIADSALSNVEKIGDFSDHDLDYRFGQFASSRDAGEYVAWININEYQAIVISPDKIINFVDLRRMTEPKVYKQIKFSESSLETIYDTGFQVVEDYNGIPYRALYISTNIATYVFSVDEKPRYPDTVSWAYESSGLGEEGTILPVGGTDLSFELSTSDLAPGADEINLFVVDALSSTSVYRYRYEWVQEEDRSRFILRNQAVNTGISGGNTHIVNRKLIIEPSDGNYEIYNISFQ